MGPIGLSILVLSALVQQIAELRSHVEVTLVACLGGECQQWNNCARAAGKQIVHIVQRGCFRNLVRQFARSNSSLLSTA
jgi:hypothetical protein